MPDLDDYLTVIEAAEALAVHPGTVKRLCREGESSAGKVHNTWLIMAGVVHSFSKRYQGRRGRPPTNRVGRE